jgi:hypothetical protein
MEKRQKDDYELDSRKSPNLRKQRTLQFYYFKKPKVDPLGHHFEIITTICFPDKLPNEIS